MTVLLSQRKVSSDRSALFRYTIQTIFSTVADMDGLLKDLLVPIRGKVDMI